MKTYLEKFEKFTCLEKNTENYINFSVPIVTEVKRIGKNEEITKTMSYRTQFIDSPRFMVSLLSNLVNNLAKEIHKTEDKYEHDDKKFTVWGIKYKDYDNFLEYTNFKDCLVE